jgi:hypothetical protein
VILLSADDSAGLEQRALSQQVDTFLPKADLFARLESVVRNVLHTTALV